MSGEGAEVPIKESGETTGASTSSSTTTVVTPGSTRRNRRDNKQGGRFYRNQQQAQGRAGTPIVNNPVRPAGPIRPRSLFTARTGNYHQDNSFQTPFTTRPSSSKFFPNDGGVTPVDVNWDSIQSNAVSAASATIVGGTTIYANNNGLFTAGTNNGGESPDGIQIQVPALLNPKSHEVYAAVHNMHEFGLFNTKQCFNFRGEPVDEHCLGALITGDGMLTCRLQHGIRVDITTDRAIRIQNNPGAIIMSLNSMGSSAAMIHPSGRVYQYGSRVEITTADHRGNAKYAKMWHKGVSFSAESCALVYLVDTAGTRTTTDSFSDLSGDFSVPIFLDNANFGPSTLNECMAHLQAAQYWLTEDGIENWIMNGIRISQTADGMVRVGRTQSKHNMRTSPFNGTASMSTPYVHCTASVGNACHLFVKRGERRMHYDGLSFIVRNAGHSAGFDDNHKLKVY